MAKIPDDMGDTMIKLIDKLAGKESDIKLSFQDLTLDVGGIKATPGFRRPHRQPSVHPETN